MRTEEEINEKICEISRRIFEEENIEVATRAMCEKDALEWALGENITLHDMRVL